MRKWIIEEAHNSNWLVECEYDSREEAEYSLKEIEECDKRNGEYKPNHYRIAEIETENTMEGKIIKTLFDAIYDALYTLDVMEAGINYNAAMDVFDKYLNSNEDKCLPKAYGKVANDWIGSDREAAAFILAKEIADSTM
jgi:hypothetical protein